MAYEPSTEAGKEAIKQGADPAVVEEQEAAGELSDVVEPEHVETKSPEGESKEPDEKDPEAGKEPGAGDDEDENDPLKHPNRTAQHIPVWKHKELLKQEADKIREEAKSEIEKALADAALKKGGATQEDVSKLAEDFNVSPEVAEAMVERMTKVVSDRLDIAGLEKKADSIKQAETQLAEQRGFQSEWDAQTTQDALKAAAGDRAISADVQKAIKEMAYTTTYAQYRLADIIRLNAGTLFPAEKSEARSSESGRGGTGRGPAAPKNLDDVSAADIENMSAKEFEEFSNKLAGGGSRFTRTTKPSGKS